MLMILFYIPINAGIRLMLQVLSKKMLIFSIFCISSAVFCRPAAFFLHPEANLSYLTGIKKLPMKPYNPFFVYMAAALAVCFGMLTFIVRKRPLRPTLLIALVTLIITSGGMLFARFTYGLGLPWWIFYGIPVMLTYVLPPLALRMSRRELFTYLPAAALMGPFIHIFFSFLFGWHEYMPPFYVPWWRDIMG